MSNKIVGALEEIVIAWRDHIAWPSSVDDVRHLMKHGPDPVDTNAHRQRQTASKRGARIDAAKTAGGADGAKSGDAAKSGDGAASGEAGRSAGGGLFGIDINTLIPTMTAMRDLGHSGLSDLDDVDDIPGLSAKVIADLRASGFVSVGDVRGAGEAKLSRVPGVGPKTLEKLLRA
jgi:hypothetical protein